MREQLRWEHAAESASPQADPTSVMHERLTAKPLLHATFIAPVRANAVDEANSVNVGATLLWKLSGTPCTVAEFSLYTLVAHGLFLNRIGAAHTRSCWFALMRPS